MSLPLYDVHILLSQICIPAASGYVHPTVSDQVQRVNETQKPNFSSLHFKLYGGS
jgi:hypothetical protein